MPYVVHDIVMIIIIVIYQPNVLWSAHWSALSPQLTSKSCDPGALSGKCAPNISSANCLYVPSYGRIVPFFSRAPRGGATGTTSAFTVPFHGGSLDVGERAWHQYLRTELGVRGVDAPQARFFLQMCQYCNGFLSFLHGSCRVPGTQKSFFHFTKS